MVFHEPITSFLVFTEAEFDFATAGFFCPSNQVREVVTIPVS